MLFEDDAARQALDWGLMELQEFLEDEELALGVKGEGPGMKTHRHRIDFGRQPPDFFRTMPILDKLKHLIKAKYQVLKNRSSVPVDNWIECVE